LNPDLDPDRRLALAYVPARRRPALEALWRLDVTLGAVLATGRDPMVSRIRLAWWRESLEKLDRAPPPAEPVLEALARRVLPEGVTGAQLAEMEQGWAELTEPHPLSRADLDSYARERGGRLFRYSALLLGEAPEPGVEQTGEAWALADLARRSSNEAEAAAALAGARERDTPRSWPRRLRPIGMLAVLARRDAVRGPGSWEPQGSPRRMLLMLRHRLTGH
jgi:phytoene synthase